MAQKQPPGDPMTLGNMRRLGVQHLVASCLRDACRHQGLIDVSKISRRCCSPIVRQVVFAKCGASGRYIDVRPN